MLSNADSKHSAILLPGLQVRADSDKEDFEKHSNAIAKWTQVREEAPACLPPLTVCA